MAKEVGRVRLEHKGLLEIGQSEQIVVSSKKSLDFLEGSDLRLSELQRSPATARVPACCAQGALLSSKPRDEWLDPASILANEAPIIGEESERRLELLIVRRDGTVAYLREIALPGTNAVLVNHVAQELHTAIAKVALVRARVEAIVAEALEHLLQSRIVLLPRAAVNNDIVDVGECAIVKYIS